MYQVIAAYTKLKTVAVLQSQLRSISKKGGGAIAHPAPLVPTPMNHTKHVSTVALVYGKTPHITS